MHPYQISNLGRLSPGERVDFFLRDCADFEAVYGFSVSDGDWVITVSEDGAESFSVWSHPDLAEAFMLEEHRKTGARPKEISVKNFLEGVVSDMHSEGIDFDVFPNNEGLCLQFPANELAKHLRDAMKEHE